MKYLTNSLLLIVAFMLTACGRSGDTLSKTEYKTIQEEAGAALASLVQNTQPNAGSVAVFAWDLAQDNSPDLERQLKALREALKEKGIHIQKEIFIPTTPDSNMLYLPLEFYKNGLKLNPKPDVLISLAGYPEPWQWRETSIPFVVLCHGTQDLETLLSKGVISAAISPLNIPTYSAVTGESYSDAFLRYHFLLQAP